MKKKILLTGITGMLGSCICRKLLKKPNCYSISGVSRKKNYTINNSIDIVIGDLSLHDTYSEISKKQFDTIIHCAAEVNLYHCEKDKTMALRNNTLSTELLLEKVDAKKFIFISTDSVFDGQTGNYTENEIPNPINQYSLSKYKAELKIKDMGSKIKSYILRTNMYGFNVPFKNSLFEWGYTQLKMKNKIDGFKNIIFNPLYIGQIADIIEDILTDNTMLNPGIYHLGANEVISKFEFLQKIGEVFNFEKKLIIPSNYSDDKLILKRPLNTSLCNQKIKNILPQFNWSIDNGFKILQRDLETLSFTQ